MHSNWQGLGIGIMLHFDLLKLARQHSKKKLIMVVHEESTALRWLVDCWGWECIGIKKDYFKNRDGYTMERRIIC